ncbi:MAG: hypothetical protein H7Y20_17685 [Bryobacteraceae bacterium]|nr:hypothetical protein [Bryobacteraceae bacterium]
MRIPAPGPAVMDEASAAKWIDPRGPDGVTLIAQHEQARPNQYPGLLTGDAPKAMMLFDLEADPSEQHDVSGTHPEIVQRLRALFEKMEEQVPKGGTPERHGASGIRRLTGGQLQYDREPAYVRSKPSTRGKQQ